MSTKPRTGLEILKAPGTTAGEIAAILGKGHPPFEEGEVYKLPDVGNHPAYSYILRGQKWEGGIA